MSRGFALPVTLFATVVIGGLVAAILFVAVIGRRSGSAMLELERVEFGADAAAVGLSLDSALAEVTSLPVSDAAVVVGGQHITRFGTPVWFLEATEFGERYGVVARSGRLLVARPPNILIHKGLTTPGSVSIVAGQVDLWGESGAEGCGVVVRDAVSEGSEYASPAYESLAGWLGRSAVVLSSTTVSPSPALTGGVCDVGNASNWGDPNDPLGVCKDHFPVVGTVGDLTVEGGRGQGVLAVTGNLTVRDGFTFRGLVIVGGRLRLEAGSQMFGAVQVDDSLGVGSVIEGRIVYSGCVLREALAGFGMISVVPDRGWFRPY